MDLGMFSKLALFITQAAALKTLLNPYQQKP